MMNSILSAHHHDLVTPDGCIKKIERFGEDRAIADLHIENISPVFVGFCIPKDHIVFNFKSALAQLGLNAVAIGLELSRKSCRAEVKVEIKALCPLSRKMLALLGEGAYIGKLFAEDERRRVRNADYLLRMFGRFDRDGRPLLSLGGTLKSDELLLDKIDDHLVAFLKLKKGKMHYQNSIEGFLPTLSLALKTTTSLRSLLRLHQIWDAGAKRVVTPGHILLACTEPLHIRTLFAQVVQKLLPKGFHHTNANILQPDTLASGDIYEFFGEAEEEIDELPLQFYKLEPYREHVFFSDRDQLLHNLEDPQMIFNAFKTAPHPIEQQAAVFIVKGTQMLRLNEEDWVTRDKTPPPPFETSTRPDIVQEYVKEHQPSYPFLRAMERGMITSQGVLFTRYFPSPLIKRMFLSYYVQQILKRVYFQIPSRYYGDYFSPQDRTLLIDLDICGIPTYWVDTFTHQILQYVQRPNKSSGLFVPLDRVETFKKATFFGIYGSNLLAGDFKQELQKLLAGILKMKETLNHPMLNKNTPLALVTGGGPGAMEVGNKIAKELSILSCAHIVDFRVFPHSKEVHEQKQNPYVEAKMSYRLDQLIERQANFYLDFPIFVMGGIGTDFELSLEELRHKVGSAATPIILFGPPQYWRKKITSRYLINKASGTIKGSEWISNSFFCIESAEEGLAVYKQYFEGTLPIGSGYPSFEDGFVVVKKGIGKLIENSTSV